MNPFISKELKKREKTKMLNGFAKLNWKIKKKEIEKIFHELFDDVVIDGRTCDIDNDLNDELCEEKYIGYDCLQVSFPLRFTGNMIIKKTAESQRTDVKKEIGARLSITTSAIGSFDVFLMPAKNGDKLIESKSLIIYSCKDPLKLTRSRIIKSVKQFLIFQRVDSLLERASIWDKVYVSWLYFWDARNREKYRSLLFQITNHWGAVAVSAAAAWFIAKNT